MRISRNFSNGRGRTAKLREALKKVHEAKLSTAILKPVADELAKEEQRENARDFAHRLVLFHSNDVFIQLVQQLRRCEEVISKHRESDGRFIAPSVQDGIYIYMPVIYYVHVNNKYVHVNMYMYTMYSPARPGSALLRQLGAWPTRQHVLGQRLRVLSDATEACCVCLRGVVQSWRRDCAAAATGAAGCNARRTLICFYST